MHSRSPTSEKGKETADTSFPDTPASATPPTTTSSLPKPLASIASAFRRSSVVHPPTTPSASQSSRPSTPLGSSSATAAAGAVAGSSTLPPSAANRPAMLIKERDATDDIDESEKSAPPAFPSLGSSNPSRRVLQGNASTRGGKEGTAGQQEGDETASEGHESNDDDSPPFDFNLFLEQMRNRSAEPIAKYLRSFLKEFNKRQWSVNDQIRVINDFLDVSRSRSRGEPPRVPSVCHANAPT